MLSGSPEFGAAAKTRNVLFVLFGIAVLILKQHYAGPADEIVRAYAGNLSVSFAVYFLFANLEYPVKFKKLLAAASALAVVELFEAFDGFGIMQNTYDPLDFLVNAFGVALAFWLDGTLSGKSSGQLPSHSQ